MKTIDDVSTVSDLADGESAFPDKGSFWRVFPWVQGKRGQSGFEVARMFRDGDKLFVETVSKLVYPVSGPGNYVIERSNKPKMKRR